MSARDTFIQEVAAQVCRRGWGQTVLWFLGDAAPFSWVGGQLLWVAEPTLRLVMPHWPTAALAELLENPNHLAELQQAIIQQEGAHQ